VPRASPRASQAATVARASERTVNARSRDLRSAARWFERQHLTEILAETGGDKREAARVLGISLASLYRKLNVGGENDQTAEE